MYISLDTIPCQRVNLCLAFVRQYMAPLGCHLLSLLIFLILDSSPSSIAVPNTSSLDHVASCDGPEPSQARRPQRVLNVDDYGAQGDGVTDDREVKSTYRFVIALFDSSNVNLHVAVGIWEGLEESLQVSCSDCPYSSWGQELPSQARRLLWSLQVSHYNDGTLYLGVRFSFLLEKNKHLVHNVYLNSVSDFGNYYSSI